MVLKKKVVIFGINFLTLFGAGILVDKEPREDVCTQTNIEQQLPDQMEFQ